MEILPSYQTCDSLFTVRLDNYKQYISEEALLFILQQEYQFKLLRQYSSAEQKDNYLFNNTYQNKFRIQPLNSGIDPNFTGPTLNMIDINTSDFSVSPQSELSSFTNNKFRLLPCRTFISSGTCPYNDKCVFLHDPRIGSFDRNATKMKVLIITFFGLHDNHFNNAPLFSRYLRSQRKKPLLIPFFGHL
jgi:hypothetical protein